MTTLNDQEDHAARLAAAIIIQRLWRNRKKTLLYPNKRWEDATTQAQFVVDRAAAYDGKNSPKERWRRAAFLVGRLQDGDKSLRASGVYEEAQAEQKHLETQHWLELVDDKHRYGSNLKWYHRRWQEADTTENFFKWLDDGQGKGLSLNECPRPQLEIETIRYLSAEQRLNYLIKIGDSGKLLWAKNNQPVDTTAGLWMDAGDGTGIIPEGSLEDPVKAVQNAQPTSSLSEQPNDVTQASGRYSWIRYLQHRTVPKSIVPRFFKKSIHRNTWIYVSDKYFNVFVGIKETGNFQHSSFVAGGLVTSAGLITVKDGIIHTLSPLSGHYRTSINHFHRFLEVLTERGVDMSKAKINKAEVTLWGTEHIAKWKRKGFKGRIG